MLFSKAQIIEEIKEMIKNNSLDNSDEVDKINEKIWGYFCSTLNNPEKKLNFNGHSNYTTELISLLESGQNIESILQEEEKKFKYEYQRKFANIKEKFLLKIREIFILFKIRAESEDKEGFTDEVISKDLSFAMRSFYAYQQCNKCGCILQSEVSCKMNIDTHQTVEINVPTGNLLIADWFRDENNLLAEVTSVKNTVIGAKMREINEYGALYGDSALNEYAAVLSAAEANVATVFVGNSCPQIFANENIIVISSEKEKKAKKLNDEGCVCTDLWRATIVDEQVLKEHVEKFYDKNQQEAVMEEMKEGANYVTVTPGKYLLHFNIDRNLLDDNDYGQSYLKVELIK